MGQGPGLSQGGCAKPCRATCHGCVCPPPPLCYARAQCPACASWPRRASATAPRPRCACACYAHLPPGRTATSASTRTRTRTSTCAHRTRTIPRPTMYYAVLYLVLAGTLASAHRATLVLALDPSCARRGPMALCRCWCWCWCWPGPSSSSLRQVKHDHARLVPARRPVEGPCGPGYGAALCRPCRGPLRPRARGCPLHGTGPVLCANPAASPALPRPALPCPALPCRLPLLPCPALPCTPAAACWL